MSQTIKGYLVEEQIGEGGFGVVYRARQSSAFDREVAIKVILPRYANEPDFIRHFESEAQTVSRLEHPHIVPLYDYWRNPDGAYLVMRWLRGGSLKEMIKQQPLNPEKADAILQQICNGLATAHQLGVIHRDIKPSNILMDEYGNAYLADFGIAKDLSKGGGNTKQDTIKGSLGYISPEQARNETITPRSDVYSLGVTLFEMLAGQHPFHDVNEIEKLYKHLNDPLPPITNLDPWIEAQVNEVIQQATAKDPMQRYADALAFARAFREAAQIDGADPANIVLSLTPREHEILHLLSEGKSNKEIANELFITVSTVRWHLRQAYKKLNVRSRIEAIIKIKELDLIVPASTSADDDGDLTHYTYIADLPNPYKGLKAFSAADTNDFFGREAFVETLLEKMSANQQFKRFLAIVGPSGSGKSSLVKAGLIPAIWRNGIPGSENWYTVELMPGSNPLAELETALIRVAADQGQNIMAQLQRDDGGLVRVGQLILPDDDSELLVVIDQFEEIFTLVEDENEREHFLNLIVKAVTEPRSRVRVVITLRADFFDRPLQYPQFGEMLRQRMETVMPLSADELERAIVEPAKPLHVAFDDGLVASIISDIHYQPGALPLLQYALSELFDRRESMVITRAAYEDIGGTTGALANQADDLYHDLTPEAKALVQQMFMRLVTLGEGTEDTRRRVSREELAALTDNVDLLDDIINIFVEKRLLATDHDPATRTPTVEVAHEALIREWETMRGWLYDSREDIKLQRRLNNAASMWQEHGHEASFLISGNRLQQFEEWATQSSLTLTDTEQAFLDASLNERDRRELQQQAQLEREANLQLRARRVLQGLVAVFLVAAIIGGGLAIFAFGEQAEAEQARKDAETERKEARRQAAIGLAGQAEAAMDAGNQDLAILLGLEALEHYPYTWQARTTLATLVTNYVPAWHINFRPDTAAVNSVEWSPDGKRVAYSTPRSIVIVDTASRAILWSVTNSPNRRASSAVQWLPDGDLATVLPVEDSDGYQLAVWDVEQQVILMEREITDIVYDMALSPDGSNLAIGTESGAIYTWNLEEDLELELFAQHAGPVRSLSWSLDGLSLAGSSNDENILVWDVETKELTTIDSGHAAPLLQVAWSPVDRHLATLSNDGTVRVLDMQSEEVLATLPIVTLSQGRASGVHADPLTEISWSNDGQSLAMISDGNQIDIWQLESQKIIQQFKGNSVIFAMTWSPDNQEIVYVGFDITAFEVRAQSLTLEEHPGTNFSARWSPDGRLLASTGYSGLFEEGDLMIYDAETLKIIQHFEYDGGGLSHFGWSPDSTKIVTGSTGDAIVWDIESGQKLYTVEIPAEEQWAQIADWSPDGNFIVLGSKGAVRLIDAATGDELFAIPLKCWGTSPRFSPDSQHVVTGCGDAGNADARKDIIIWSTQTGEIEYVFNEHADYTLAAAWSNDGTMIVSGDDTGRVLIWKAATGEIVDELTGHSGKVNGVTWSSDDSLIAATSIDGTSIIWEVASRTPIQIFEYEGISGQPFFSPDDKYLLVSHTNTGRSATLHRVWKSTDNLIDYANKCCVVRELTPAEREQFGLPPHE